MEMGHFEDFYNNTYTDMVRFTISKGVTLYDAEEIVNDAYMRLWNVWCRDENIKNINASKTWLYRAISLIIMEYRRKAEPENEDIDEYSSMIPIDDDNLDKVAENDILNQYYNEIKSIFKGKDRELFELKFIQDYSDSECAKILHIKDGTLRSKVSRIRKKAKSQFKKIMK